MNADNGLITKPIPGLIAQLAIPASIGMFFNTMFNVVDTYFSGLISTEAIAALSLSFPVFFIILAIGFGISTGTTALIANALGVHHPFVHGTDTDRSFCSTLFVWFSRG
jgi:Na+-driven multidrug efflux pump